MFLGLDLGTSGLRALLAAPDGMVIASAEANYDVSRPAPGWSEQDPFDWVAACKAVIAELKSVVPQQMAQVQGLAISGHMHGATLLDEAGSVLRPCILWNDTRSAVEAADLDAEPAFRAISGNIVFPGFTAPKLVWVAKHEPDIFARTAKVLLPKDYLGWYLTNRYVSDMSDSAGTSWMDVGARAWSDRLLAASGMRRDQMPELVEGSDVIGPVTPLRSAELGLPDGVLVMGGGGDNAVAACGIGALAEGDGFVSLGTSGVLLAARDGFSPDAASAVHSFCHAVPGRWYQMGVILSATDSLNWLSGVVGASPADLTKALGGTVKDPGPLRFLPYLSGERTPHNDADVRGAFVGVDVGMTRDDLTRAVIEGVSFALRDSLEALRSTGANPERLIAIGGGVQSTYWVELLANVLGLPLDLPEQGEFGAAMGAARLAACGVTGADPAALMTKPQIAKTIHPDPARRAVFVQAYQAYASSYSTLKAMP
ncbi:MAG: xylulokinase [Pseudomonadota bacterium]